LRENGNLFVPEKRHSGREKNVRPPKLGARSPPLSETHPPPKFLIHTPLVS